jgi:hypothetical protein
VGNADGVGNRNDVVVLRRRFSAEGGNSTCGKLAIFITLLLGALVLLDIAVSGWALAGAPFFTQIVTTLVYTAAMFLFIFFRTKAFNTGYDLDDEAVREKLSRLLVIHGVFLVLLLSVQAGLAAVGPHLPGYWLSEYSRHNTLFDDARIVIYVSVGTAQVLICRGILGRSVEAHTAKPADAMPLVQEPKMSLRTKSSCIGPSTGKSSQSEWLSALRMTGYK